MVYLQLLLPVLFHLQILCELTSVAPVENSIGHAADDLNSDLFDWHIFKLPSPT